MPETFEKATDIEREEKETSGIGRGEQQREGGKSPVTFDGERLEQAVEQFEDWVTATPDELRERIIREEQQIRQQGQSLEVDISQQSGFGLDQLLDNIQGTTTNIQSLQNILEFTDLPDTVLVNNLGVEDLLQLQLRVLVDFIAPNTASIGQLLKIISSTNAQQLSALLNIVQEVRPFGQIVVSGENIIENTDEPEPVIPNSDTSSVPTRRIYVRAAATNDDPIAFGDDDIDPDNGFFLRAGGTETFNQNFANQVLWMAGTQGDSVKILGYL